MGSRGLSVVDICLSSPDIFGLIKKFQVASFTMYSDHAPLHLHLWACSVVTEPKGENTVADNSFTPPKSWKWNPECLNEARITLATCYENLMSATKTPKHETQDSIDSSIELFTTQLTKAMMPLFEDEHSSKPLYRKKTYSSRTPIDKPWVTTELKGKYNKYRYHLNLFNRDKGGDNHSNLLQSKKEYKTHAAKLKRQYMRTEGHMLNQFLDTIPSYFINISKERNPIVQMSTQIF